MTSEFFAQEARAAGASWEMVWAQRVSRNMSSKLIQVGIVGIVTLHVTLLVSDLWIKNDTSIGGFGLKSYWNAMNMIFSNIFLFIYIYIFMLFMQSWGALIPGVGFCWAMNWLSNFGVTLSFPVLAKADGSPIKTDVLISYLKGFILIPILFGGLYDSIEDMTACIICFGLCPALKGCMYHKTGIEPFEMVND